MTANLNSVLAMISVLGACGSHEAERTASISYVFEPSVVKALRWVEPDQTTWHYVDTYSVFRMRAEPGLVRSDCNTMESKEYCSELRGPPPSMPETKLFWRDGHQHSNPSEDGIDDSVTARACRSTSADPAWVRLRRNGRDVVICSPVFGSYGSDTLIISQAYVGHTVVRCEIRAWQPSRQQLDDLVDSCTSVSASSCTETSTYKETHATCD